MAKRLNRTQYPDLTTCEIVITPESGEAAVMSIADFIRERSDVLGQAIEHVLAGEEVAVASDDGTYTVKLVTDDEANRHGRFISSRDLRRSRERIQDAPSNESRDKLEAVS